MISFYQSIFIPINPKLIKCTILADSMSFNSDFKSERYIDY